MEGCSSRCLGHPAVGSTGRSAWAITSSSLGVSLREGVRKRGRMAPNVTGEFSEATLQELLRALRERTSTHPDNPGLIASWPGVPEDRMAAACTLLINQGYPLFKVSIATARPGVTRDGWALRAGTDEPVATMGASGARRSSPSRV